MTLVDSVILGIVQGITEFLPISSSGHLIVIQDFMKLDPVQLKSFDIAVHVGTLLALLIYFRKDFLLLARGLVNFTRKWFRQSELTPADQASVRMIFWLFIGMIPAVIIGLLFDDLLDEWFRNGKSVAIMLIVVGLLFFVVESIAKKVQKSELNFRRVIVIGLAQALALVPGVSRSGATISAGLVQGVKREDAAKFSFFLGSTAIFAATVLACYYVSKGKMILPAWDVLSVGVLSSFLAGYVCIAFLMQYLKKHSLAVFGVYRILFGLSLLFILS